MEVGITLKELFVDIIIEVEGEEDVTEEKDVAAVEVVIQDPNAKEMIVLSSSLPIESLSNSTHPSPFPQNYIVK